MKRTRNRKRKKSKFKGMMFFVIFIAVSAILGYKFFNSSNHTLTTFLGGNKTVSPTNSVDANKNTASDVQAKIDESKKEQNKTEEKKGKDTAEIDKVKEENEKKEAAKKEQVENNKNKEEKKKNEAVKNENSEGDKIAYLTFDDGPSYKITPQILDILKEKNIKATFFVIGSMAGENPGLLKREKNEGHVIANHTYSHDYKKIYSSTSNFINDLKKGENVVTSIIGEYNSKLIRFPGGSFGRTAYKNAVTNAGYHYVDWNALNGDAEAPYVRKEKLIARLKETAAGQKTLYILMHDAPGKQSTVEALPEIIEYLKAQGYEFRTLQ
ncbi:polysaccharide deacetylase family protein [Clostridium lundense]|uniref:polysaccharide deacetylase family protein n=1 Tax=Clostridium lundense TaxID=319475 RepID=UPI000485A95D|nr:polysaccharide deacetylase family protein [Clostridium lundense]